MACAKAFVVASVFATKLAAGMQFRSSAEGHHWKKAEESKMDNFIQLDETEVNDRGSLCLDGKMPGFYFEPAKGTADSTKWVLGLQGGGWCKSEEECASRTKGDLQEMKPSTDKLSIFSTADFESYNHVLFWYCDGGLFSGDAAAPVTVPDPDDSSKSITLYFRGRRILDHILDTLIRQHGLSEATEVLLTGGSAGGLSTYMLADYIGTKMPSSVTKFRAAPQSGFWAFTAGTEAGDAELDNAQNKYFYEMQNLGAVVPPACKQAMPTNQEWHCMFADVSYKYTKTPMFVMQVLDNFVAVLNETKEENAKGNFKCVAVHMDESGCDSHGAQRLNKVLDGVVGSLQSTEKFNRPGEGGFVTTCNLHSVYKWDEFFHYARDGVTMDKAVGKWWSSPPDAEADWKLPCRFNGQAPYQCEKSCAFQHDES